MEENKEEKNINNSSDSSLLFIGDIISEVSIKGVVSVGESVVEVIQNNVVTDFLKEKFNFASDAAIEVATKLPKAVIEKIETFDGEGLSNIGSAVSETIKSIELPDIDFPDIDF